MKKTGFLLFFFLFLMLSSVTFANNHDSKDQLKTLNHIADQVLQLGKQQKYEEAKKILENFSPVFLKQTSEQQLSMKKVKMIIYTYEQAESAVTSVRMSHEERIKHLTQFRLAVDALSSKHQPLWQDAKTMVMTPLQQAVTSLNKGEGDKFQYYLNEFFAYFEVIRPALVIDLSETVMERIESYVRFLENERSAFEKDENKREQLSEIQQAFHQLFEKSFKNNATPGLIEVIYTIGGAIIITLIYVGWRKYKGHKEEKKRKYHRNEL